MMLRALAAVCLLIASSEAFNVTNKGWYISRVYVGEESFKIAVLWVEFDEDIYLANNVGDKKPVKFSTLEGKLGDMPKTTMYGLGVAKFSCAGTPIPNMPATMQTYPENTEMDGPPTGFYMTGAGTMEPHATLLGSFGGKALTETVYPKRMSFLSIIGMTSKTGQSMDFVTYDQFKACKVKITFPGDVNANITGATLPAPQSQAGVKFTGDVMFTEADEKAFKCSKDTVAAVSSAMKEITGMEVAGQREVQMLMMTLGSIESRAGYGKCQELVDSMMEFKLVDEVIQGDMECHAPDSESLEFMNDPCCNDNHKECCVPSTSTVKVEKLEGIVEKVVNASCGHPETILNLLKTYLNLQKASKVKEGDDADIPDDPEKAWSAFDIFLPCYKQVYPSGECKADSDCLSERCKNKRCATDPENQDRAWAKCILKEAKPIIKKQYFVDFKLDINGTADKKNPEAIKKFTEAFSKAYGAETCIGPSSWDYALRYDYSSVNEDGEPEEKEIPGNKTGCLSEKNCNHDEWQRDTEAKCLEGGTHFCAMCWQGAWCWDTTTMPTCYPGNSDSASNLTECQSVGGANATFRENGWPRCYYPGVANMSDCYSKVLNGASESIFCNKSAGEDYWSYYCSHGACYIHNATMYNSSTCNDMSGHIWDHTSSRCILKDHVTKADCQNKGANYTYFGGLQFNKGYLDTKEKCEAVSCSIDSVAGSTDYRAPANQSECEAQGRCKMQCWEESDFTCKNQTQCNSTGYCEADGELFNHCPGNTADCGICIRPMPANRICDSGGQSGESEKSGGSGGDGHMQMSDHPTRLGCTVYNNNTKAKCEASGFKWYAEPSDQKACEALAATCDEGDGDMWEINPKNASECTKCGGKVVPLYKWEPATWEKGVWGKGKTWKTRAWETENKWGTYFSDGKFQQGYMEILGKIMGNKLLNDLRRESVWRLALFNDVACDCDGTRNQSNGCFGVPKPVPGKVCSSVKTGTTECGGVTVAGYTGAISISSVPSYAIVAAANNGAARKPQGGLSVHPRHKHLLVSSVAGVYAIIANSNGGIIGQLLGNAKGFDVNNVQVYLCLDKDPNIQHDKALYPVFDFAKGKPNQATMPGPPLEVNVVVNGNQLCANVTGNGTYFPIARLATFKTVTGTPTRAPSKAPTKRPTVIGETQRPTNNPTPWGWTFSPTAPTKGPTTVFSGASSLSSGLALLVASVFAAAFW